MGFTYLFSVVFQQENLFFKNTAEIQPVFFCIALLRF